MACPRTHLSGSTHDNFHHQHVGKLRQRPTHRADAPPAVLEAGVTILFAKGPEAVTHAAVASDARVSRTTVYKHCPSAATCSSTCLASRAAQAVDPSGDLRADMQQMGRQMALRSRTNGSTRSSAR